MELAPLLRLVGQATVGTRVVVLTWLMPFMQNEHIPAATPRTDCSRAETQTHPGDSGGRQHDRQRQQALLLPHRLVARSLFWSPAPGDAHEEAQRVRGAGGGGGGGDGDGGEGIQQEGEEAEGAVMVGRFVAEVDHGEELGRADGGAGRRGRSGLILEEVGAGGEGGDGGEGGEGDAYLLFICLEFRALNFEFIACSLGRAEDSRTPSMTPSKPRTFPSSLLSPPPRLIATTINQSPTGPAGFVTLGSTHTQRGDVITLTVETTASCAAFSFTSFADRVLPPPSLPPSPRLSLPVSLSPSPSPRLSLHVSLFPSPSPLLPLPVSLSPSPSPRLPLHVSLSTSPSPRLPPLLRWFWAHRPRGLRWQSWWGAGWRWTSSG